MAHIDMNNDDNSLQIVQTMIENIVQIVNN